MWRKELVILIELVLHLVVFLWSVERYNSYPKSYHMTMIIFLLWWYFFNNTLLTYHPYHYSRKQPLFFRAEIYSLAFMLTSLALVRFAKNTLEHIKHFNIFLTIQSSSIRFIFTRFLLYSLLYFCCFFIFRGVICIH